MDTAYSVVYGDLNLGGTGSQGEGWGLYEGVWALPILLYVGINFLVGLTPREEGGRGVGTAYIVVYGDLPLGGLGSQRGGGGSVWALPILLYVGIYLLVGWAPKEEEGLGCRHCLYCCMWGSTCWWVGLPKRRRGVLV